MTTKKKILLFDIDYTLFNAQQFRNDFFTILAKNIPHSDRDKFLEVLEEVYELSKRETSFFDPYPFLKVLSEKISLPSDTQSLVDAIMHRKLLESSLYNEVVQVLEVLARDPELTLGIFSWGSVPVQKAKIKQLERFFKERHVHIVELNKRNELPAVLKKYQDDTVYLIDDYQDVLIDAKALHPDIHTVWIRRPEIEGKRRIFDNFAPDSIIRTLSDIIPLVQKGK